MESRALLTTDYKLDSAKRFIDSIEKNDYYFFAGNHLNPNNVIAPSDNPRETLLSVYYNMIFGKKVKNNDAHLMIKRYDYQVNTRYTAYDHTESNLYDKNFYAIVKEGSQYDVFKCLDNNNNGVSTVAPSRTVVNTQNDDFYYPTDGYRWKYMYSVSESTANKFATEEYFPTVVDLGVRSRSTIGAIDVIKVTNPGAGYANYLSGQFKVGDIRLNGNPKLYGLSSKNINNANGFYDACWIYISSGPGAGQFRKIESYTSNTTYNFIELTDAFDSTDTPESTSTFEIYPSVRIIGDGNETIEANARAIINPNGNTVNHVEMLERGRDYNLASASVMYSASVGVTTQAGVRPIYSPTNGHGYNPPAELGSREVCVSLKLVGDENGSAIVNNDYSQIGLIKNPQFRKVTLSLSALNQQFSTNEIVRKISPVQLAGRATTVRNSNNVISTQLNVQGMTPSDNLKVGDQLFLKYDVATQIANVVSTSNTSIVLDSQIKFDTNSTYSANIYYANATSSGLVDGFSANVVDLTYSNSFSVGDKIIGQETGTYGVVTQIKITDVIKNFNSFIQCYTYIGSMVQGQFTADEEVYQIANEIAAARYHSIADNTSTGTLKFYLTNQLGVFNTSVDGDNLSDKLIGSISGSIATLTDKYLPDLVFGSGEIHYVNNFNAINRSDQKTETHKLILNF